jgi:hypothetical protein
VHRAQLNVSSVRAAGLVLLGILVVASTSAHAQDSARGLRGLSRVVLEISLSPDVVDLRDDVEQRAEQALREQAPAPALVRDGADKLRLVVTVQAKNATELRGFWLPLSGTYAIGYVRIEIERAVTLPGPAPSVATVPAVVWQADQLIACPWRQADGKIYDAVEKLVGAFLEDYRRTRGR